MWSRLFYKEAEHLWLTRRNVDEISTVVALQYLYLGCSAGEDSHAIDHMRDSIAMAKRLGLICPPTRAPSGTPKLQRALCHSAWGIFNMLMYGEIHKLWNVPCK